MWRDNIAHELFTGIQDVLTEHIVLVEVSILTDVVFGAGVAVEEHDTTGRHTPVTTVF